MENTDKNSEKQTDAKSPRRVLNASAFVVCAAAFSAAIWIIVPAPSYYVWLFSVAAGEWSLALGALAVFGIFCSLIFGCGKMRIASIFLGTAALVISLYPFFSAFAAARKHNASLSPARYVSGFRVSDKIESDKKTFTFAEVGGQTLRLDVYSPNEAAKNGASVVIVHGGSWSAGARSDFPQLNRRLAEQGYTIFDIDYRLAPQPNYLSATGDVKCAVLWIKRNAAQFNVSPDRIVLLGRSAGAHLALLAAYTANDKDFPSSYPNAGENTPDNEKNEKSESVRAVVSFYAPTDLLWSFDNPANQSVIDGQKTLSDFLGGNPHESNEIRERFRLASPTARVTAETPPTLLIHGGRDQLVRSENMNFLNEKLTAANIPRETLFLSYAQHGFDYNPDGWGAQVAESVLLGFLRENSR